MDPDGGEHFAAWRRALKVCTQPYGGIQIVFCYLNGSIICQETTHMRLLVVGLGSIGMRHARNFKSLGVESLVGCDLLEERRQKFSSEISTEIVSTFEDGLLKKPDLVVIASPNCFHLEQAIISAQSSCHLFIEKPLSHTLEGLDELITLVDEKSLFAHVGSNWKFHPAFKTMKKIINEGSLGKITGARVIAGQWLPDWHPWEDYRQMYSAKKSLAGGVVLDSHEFDYLTWLLGPISKVSGYTAHTGALDIETEDIAVACMQFESGVLATVHIDYIQRDYRRRYHISGDAGTLEWDYTTGEITHYNAVRNDSTKINVAINELNTMYMEQSRHILAGVKGTELPVTSISDARHVLENLLAIKGPYDKIN